MRYEDARRLRGVESVWLHLKFWLNSVHLRSRTPTGDMSHLSEHGMRDIGLHETVRYMDGEPVRSMGWCRFKDQGHF